MYVQVGVCVCVLVKGLFEGIQRNPGDIGFPCLG